MKDRLTLFTKYLLDVLFYAGIVVTVTLPFSIRFYGKYDSYFGQHWLRLTILFGISGIFALILLQELRKMFKTVLNGDCFIRENVQSLKRMGICSFCIAAVTALRLFLLFPLFMGYVRGFSYSKLAHLLHLIYRRRFNTGLLRLLGWCCLRCLFPNGSEHHSLPVPLFWG